MYIRLQHCFTVVYDNYNNNRFDNWMVSDKMLMNVIILKNKANLTYFYIVTFNISE
jgi:hypothetical protein